MKWRSLPAPTRVSIMSLGFIHLAFALAVFLGGAVRFPPPTYAPLLQFTHGETWPYGVAFLLAGGLMLSRRITWLVPGLVIGVIIMNLWSALFLVAVFLYPSAGATATVAYGGYALLDSVVLAKVVLYWRRQKTHTGS